MLKSRIAHYRILRQLDSGGMGVVYLAEDTRLKRQVVLKVLPGRLYDDNDARDRFLHEAQAASALDHPNICTIYETGHDDEGQPFIAMAYYRGETLKQLLQRGPLNVNRALDITIQIARGLQAAHARGIIHRDIKPANIMLTPDGIVKILDFGLAKVRGSSLITREGSTMGTIAYMSPEQTRGDEVDFRSDIWSLGAILYEMLSGERPFQGDFDPAVIYSILNTQPKPLKQIPQALEWLVLKCLQKDVEHRYADMGALLAELQEFDTSGHSGNIRPPASVKRRYRKRALIAVGLLTLSLLGIWEIGIGPQETQPVGIAVLPFELVASAKDAYLAFGLLDGLITELARLDGFKVIARSSVAQYQNKARSASEIAVELGVPYLLEGSLIHQMGNLQVSVQLIEAAHNAVIWAEKASAVPGDMPDLQRKIATTVARKLGVETNMAGTKQTRQVRPVNRAALDKYLRGIYFYHKFNPEYVRQAVELWQESLAIDSTFAPAYTALAEYYFTYVLIQKEDRPAIRKGKELIEKAIRLDPLNGEAFAMRGIYYMMDWQWTKALQDFEKATRLNSSSSLIRQWYMQLLRELRRYDEAARQIALAQELDPNSILLKNMAGWVYFDQGRMEEALEQFRTVLEMEPRFGMAYYNISLVYLKQGRFPEARRAAQKSIEIMGPDFIIGKYLLAIAETKIAGRGMDDERIQAMAADYQSGSSLSLTYLLIAGIVLQDNEAVFHWLESGLTNRNFLLPNISSEIWFESYRGDNRFRELRRRMGLDGLE